MPFLQGCLNTRNEISPKMRNSTTELFINVDSLSESKSHIISFMYLSSVWKREIQKESHTNS